MTWLYLASMESLSAQVSECSTKDSVPHSSILESTTALSLTSKGKLLLPRSLSRLWNRVPSIRRLSGLTLSHSTAEYGAERWIASQPDSHANHAALPENAQDSKTSAGYGLTSLESFAKLNRHLCGSKTCQDLFQQEASNTSFLTLPASGSMRNGNLCQRPRSVPHTSANVSSSSHGAWERWDTPDTMPEAPNSGSNRKGQPAGLGNQAMTIAVWATPGAQAGMRGNYQDGQSFQDYINRGHQLKLEDQAVHWPTPSARDMKGENGEVHMQNGTGRLHLDQLPNFVKFVYLRPPPTTNDGEASPMSNHTSPRRLNPAFASWLMGWPWWWTNPGQISFARSEMASYRFSLQQHLYCLLAEPELFEQGVTA